MCVYIYSCGRVHMCACMHVETIEQPWILYLKSCLPCIFSFSFLFPFFSYGDPGMTKSVSVRLSGQITLDWSHDSPASISFNQSNSQRTADIVLAPYPQCWDYKHLTPHPAFYADSGAQSQIPFTS